MTTYAARAGQVAYGVPIGLLMLDCAIPFIPGDVGNASTYGYPVVFETVRGASTDAIVNRDDPALTAEVVRAAEHLVGQGVRAITSDCGYLGKYQALLAERLPVPVFVSSLLQAPLIGQMLGPKKTLGVLCANADGLTEALLASVGITDTARVAFRSLKHKKHFYQVIFEESVPLDPQLMEDELVQAAVEAQEQIPGLGAFLLECSDLPPYGHAIQQATGLPVFDWIGFIDFVHHAVVRQPYRGIY